MKVHYKNCAPEDIQCLERFEPEVRKVVAEKGLVADVCWEAWDSGEYRFFNLSTMTDPGVDLAVGYGKAFLSRVSREEFHDWLAGTFDSSDVARLDDFLKAEDLDDLLKVRGRMGDPVAQELDRIAELLEGWSDGQAVSNLLFYPALIPEALRIRSIDRALACTDRPYFILAAVVGLQGIDPASVPADTRARWAAALLEIVRSNAGVISSRASVTVWSWLRDGQIEEFIRSYPVPDETASKNIISFTLSRFGDLALPEFRARLGACGVGFWRRRDFLRRFQEYQHRKQAGGAGFMTMPLLSYIPNYGSMERLPG